MDLLRKYFPHFTDHQHAQLEALPALYAEWNTKINVVSRKDMDNFAERHLLHCLAMTKVLTLSPGSKVIDAGTGGGLPGVPLAVVFPETEFLLVDSTAKKLRVAENIAERVGLSNLRVCHARLEQLREQADFVTARAVTRLAGLWQLTRHLVRPGAGSSLPNGLLTLKGGDLASEVGELPSVAHETWRLSEWLEEPFFETKGLVWVGRQTPASHVRVS